MSELFVSRAKIDLFNQCGLRFDLKYIKKEKGLVETDTEQFSLFGNLVHTVLERYFTAGNEKKALDIYKEQFEKSAMASKEFFDKGYLLLEEYIKDMGVKEVLGVEVPFQLHLENGVPVKGVIDRIDKLSEEEVELIDYKTGFLSITENEMRGDIQLGIYELVVRQLYPWAKKVKLTLNYLNFGPTSIYKTDEERVTLNAYLISMYNRIDRAIEEKQELKPRINKFCSFCEYKSKCTEYKTFLSSKGVDEEDTFNGIISPANDIIVPIEQVDVFLDRLKAKSKILKDMQDKVNDFLKAYIKANGSEKGIQLGKRTFYLAKKKYTDYDVNTVVDLFKDKIDLNLVLEPRKLAIDGLIEKDKEATEALQKTKKTKYSEPYVK